MKDNGSRRSLHKQFAQARVDGYREAARSLSEMMLTSPDPHIGAEKSYYSVEDAVVDLGLTTPKQLVAQKLMREIVQDTRSLYGIAKDGKEAGLDQYTMTALIRRGVRMVNESKVRNRDLQKAATSKPP